MPIKLLQHKSWHVYSKDNIERVRRDEAKERARIEEEKKSLHQHDSDARLHKLRQSGDDVAPALSSAQVVERDASVNKSLKRKRENSARLHDKLLSGREKRAYLDNEDNENEASWLPQSEFVVSHNSKDNRVNGETFASLVKHSWHEDISSQPGTDAAAAAAAAPGKSRRMNERIKEEMDPLKKMRTFLARKKAVTAAKRKTEAALEERNEREEDVHVRDRYHAVPSRKAAHPRERREHGSRQRQ